MPTLKNKGPVLFELMLNIAEDNSSYALILQTTIAGSEYFNEITGPNGYILNYINPLIKARVGPFTLLYYDQFNNAHISIQETKSSAFIKKVKELFALIELNIDVKKTLIEDGVYQLNLD